MATDSHHPQHETLFGHPVGLYTLFFAEMWERFSYYGMRALLILYLTKGFLNYDDGQAYTIYGAYTALVYMTPFFGGMIADRLIGARRAVVLGGLLMAGGHLMMTIEDGLAFFLALALLICGNGFFKPNISTMVGSLYAQKSPRRDGGFTIFYIGINLGAAMAPLLCGYIGETYGWHKGFGLATIGMLAGVTVFVAPTVVSQVFLLIGATATAWSLAVLETGSSAATTVNWIVAASLVLAGATAWFGFRRQTGEVSRNVASIIMNQLLIGVGALVAAYLLFKEHPDNLLTTSINYFIAIALLLSASIACLALWKGGLPYETGQPISIDRMRRRVGGLISAEWVVYLGTLVSIPVFMLLVSGLEPTTGIKGGITLISGGVVERLKDSANPITVGVAEIVEAVSRPAGIVLFLAGAFALVYLLIETFRVDKIQRQRMFVVLILTFYSFLFWAFFEQAGSSISIFTDRNVDRVKAEHMITADEVGKVIRLQPTQEQLGYHNGDRLFTIDKLDTLRERHEDDASFEIEWTVTKDNIGMGVAPRDKEIRTSTGQAFNPVYILVFGLVFTALWDILGSINREPSIPFKFALGLFQLALGFGALWYGAHTADDRGMVLLVWLFVGYLLHTTGELCLSPVGLSMVTKLSPAHLVSTVMGTWFLATAFSQYLAAIIAQFTSIKAAEDGTLPPPTETIDIYGQVFGWIAIAGIVLSLSCFMLVPVLKRWMHEETMEAE